jgi:hypothetical protein
MPNEYQETREEAAYWLHSEDQEDMLSEAARSVLEEAEGAAFAAFMVRNYCFQWPMEYEEAMEKMRQAATELTKQDRELLTELWRLALGAAASIDPDDETPAGSRASRGDLHQFWRMFSGMVEETLRERKRAEFDEKRRKELAERESEDLSDLPF